MTKIKTSYDTLLDDLSSFYEPHTWHFLTLNGIDLCDGTIELQWIFSKYGSREEVVVYYALNDFETPAPSIVSLIPSSIMGEREVVDMFGLRIEGAEKGLYLDKDSKNYSAKVFPVSGKKKVVNIPLGSQHISLLEPIRFQFTTENEKIVDVGADVGFVHRGIEKACTEQFEWKKVPYVVARVCGLCAITHSLTYTLAVEKLLGYEANDRIKYLRILMVELDRIHSHMLCLAHVSEDAGFEAMFMQIMADRELVMDLQEAISGNRIQFDYIAIGGVNRDITTELVALVHRNLDLLQPKIDTLMERFSSNWSLSLKYKGVGVLDFEDACTYNAIGPLARAAGLKTDVRAESTELPYDEVGFEMVLESSGDIYARNMVRLREIYNSMAICRNIVDNLPSGEIITKVKGKPEGETAVRLEAPRGEIFYLVKASKKNFLDRMRIKTPTFSAVPAMVEVFKGSEYADAPAILASFDPCMSCTAK